MLQSLISLQDDQIEIVLAAVTEWCSEHDVSIDSPDGRRAILAAVDVISNYQMSSFRDTLAERLAGITNVLALAPTLHETPKQND